RLVDKAHATGFAHYWLSTSQWISPPILLDTPHQLGAYFVRDGEVQDLAYGRLWLPGPAVSGLSILDGQHRVLGWATLRSSLETALAGHETSMPKISRLSKSQIVEVLGRMGREPVTLEVLDSTSLADHKQWFYDIASNAKGITKSLTAQFDGRSEIN